MKDGIDKHFGYLKKYFINFGTFLLRVLSRLFHLSEVTQYAKLFPLLFFV